MHVLTREPGVYGGGDMHQLRLRAVGVAAGLALAAGALFFGPIQSAASSWSIVSSPNSGTGGNGLVGVACASSNSCTAVGNYANSSGTSQTLIESWNGSGWSIVPSPNIGTHVNYLDAVACISSSSCTAVGAYIYDSSLDTRTLIESWDGTSWSIVASPNPGIADLLNGVACASPSFCTAVGTYSPSESSGIGPRTLIEGWNGTSWSIVTSPNIGTHINDLGAVSCVSSDSCTAVGWYFKNSSGDQTLIEAWNGSNWSIVSSPNIAANANFLSGVSCISSRSCTAVGNESFDRTLIESLNGVRWSIVPSPSSGLLFGVSCISFKSLKSCTAVGLAGYQTLIESRKGNKWSIVASPNTGTDDFLNGVACVSSGFCTAVGYYYNSGSGVFQTLIESQ